MTFLLECWADKFVFHPSVFSSPIMMVHNDSMYVRFCGIKNKKTWRKSRKILEVHLCWNAESINICMRYCLLPLFSRFLNCDGIVAFHKLDIFT